MELADVTDSKSVGLITRAGSTPAPGTIKHAVENKRLRIGLRFAYDDVTYPVTYINFYPYELEKEFQCVMEQ